jgi:branched-chain amino acid transport system ATP-binding protein
MSIIMSISQRIMVLNFGEKLAEGLPGNIQGHPEVIKAYLGETTDLELEA